MRKILTALVAAATIAAAAVPMSNTAEAAWGGWHGGWHGGGWGPGPFFGGLAAGAIIGGALAAPITIPTRTATTAAAITLRRLIRITAARLACGGRFGTATPGCAAASDETPNA